MVERYVNKNGVRMVFDSGRCTCNACNACNAPCWYCEGGGHEDDDPPRGMVALGRRAQRVRARMAWLTEVIVPEYRRLARQPHTIEHEPWNLPHPPRGSRGVGWSIPLAVDEEG